MPRHWDEIGKPQDRTRTSKYSGWEAEEFPAPSSVFIVTNAVKVSAERDGVGRRDNEEV